MEAPGGPGAPPMWGPGRKMAFGSAPGSRSKVWYSLADGNLSEVFFPFLDRVALHELRFFVSAGGAQPVDDAVDGQHSISWLKPGVPAFHVDSTHHEYRLTKEFFSDPEENAMLIAATFTPELPDLRLYLQASAHWQPGTKVTSAASSTHILRPCCSSSRTCGSASSGRSAVPRSATSAA